MIDGAQEYLYRRLGLCRGLAAMYTQHPQWKRIVPLMIAGHDAAAIATITGIRPGRVRRALKDIAEFGVTGLHHVVENFQRYRRFYELSAQLENSGLHGTLEGVPLMAEIIFCAPPEVKAIFNKIADDSGLFPAHTHCDQDGQPLFSVGEVASHFGLDEAEVKADFDEMNAQHKLPAGGVVHRIN